jgi:pyruvate,water dikinase
MGDGRTGSLPDKQIRIAFAEMAGDNDNMAVAVRSSATAEDLPDASFAGQQGDFLEHSLAQTT